MKSVCCQCKISFYKTKSKYMLKLQLCINTVADLFMRYFFNGLLDGGAKLLQKQNQVKLMSL